MNTLTILALFVTLSLATQSSGKIIKEEIIIRNLLVFTIAYENDSDLRFNAEQSYALYEVADGTRRLVKNYLEEVAATAFDKDAPDNRADIIKDFTHEMEKFSDKMCEKLRASDVTREQMRGSLKKGFNYAISLTGDREMRPDIRNKFLKFSSTFTKQDVVWLSRFLDPVSDFINYIFRLDLDSSMILDLTTLNFPGWDGNMADWDIETVLDWWPWALFKVLGYGDMLINLNKELAKLSNKLQTCYSDSDGSSGTLSHRLMGMDESCMSKETEKKKSNERKFASNYNDADMDLDNLML